MCLETLLSASVSVCMVSFIHLLPGPPPRPPPFLPGVAFGICMFSSLHTHNGEAFGKEVSPALRV